LLFKTLDNGLDVFIYEDHRAPIFSFVILYKVGSMDERPGITGISHMLEHMVFKGSDKIDGTELNYHVKRHGGYLNAMTSEDKTVYFMTMPVSEREYPIKIWGDLMNNVLINPDEYKSERNVVIEERRLSTEDDPIGALFESLNATAYWAHPYRWPVIGWMSDIQNISYDQVHEYYKTFYRPDNAVIVASGDINPDEILGMIEKHFGGITKGTEPIIRANTIEPEQIGMRRSTIHKPAELPVIMMGFHAPGIDDSALYPLLIAEKILSSGESSRIYRNIIHEKRLATMAGGFFDYVKRDPGLFIFYAQASPDKNLETLEDALWDEVERMRSGDFSIEEIEKAKNILEAQFVYRREKGLMESLIRGEFHLVSSMDKYDSFIERIREVNPEDIKNTCAHIFRKDNATVSNLVPAKGSGVSISGGNNANFKPDRRCNYRFEPPLMSSPDLPDGLPFWNDADKFELSNGISVVAYHRENLPIVQVGLIIQAGAVFDPNGKAGLARLTGKMIKAGTESRSSSEIAEEIERVGGSFDVSVDRETLKVSTRCLSRFLKTNLDVVSECLIYPKFDDSELTRYKEMQSGDIKSIEDDAWILGAREFIRNLYEDSPYGNPLLGDLETVDSISHDDILQFHKKYYTGSNTLIVVVGDYDKASLQKELELYFSKMPAGERFTPPEYEHAGYGNPLIKRYQKELSQSTIAIGAPLFNRSDNDFFPWLVLNLIFGGDPLASRLGDTVREKHGLTYNIQSGFHPLKKIGYWNVMTQTKNESTDKAVSLIRDEMRKLREISITDDDLKDAKSNFRGRSALEIESNRGLAIKLLSVAYHDLGDYYLANFFRNVEEVTSSQIMEVAEKYLDPDRFLLMIVGDEKQTPVKL
jgi:zinc protease